LPYFDIETGRPIKYEKIEKWPSIKHKEYGNKKPNNTLLYSTVKTLIKNAIGNFSGKTTA
jgi:hypothetical protein